MRKLEWGRKDICIRQIDIVVLANEMFGGSIDSLHIMRYNAAHMKKLIIGLIVLAFLALPKAVFAEEETTICTQSYGGGVVCGVHTPIQTGVADNIPLIGSLVLGSSGIFFYFSKKENKNGVNQNN